MHNNRTLKLTLKLNGIQPSFILCFFYCDMSSVRKAEEATHSPITTLFWGPASVFCLSLFNIHFLLSYKSFVVLFWGCFGVKGKGMAFYWSSVTMYKLTALVNLQWVIVILYVTLQLNEFRTNTNNIAKSLNFYWMSLLVIPCDRNFCTLALSRGITR